MDYKNKYEQALERARIWKDKSGMPKDKQGILDDIFPELKESEDEEIKGAIIHFISHTPTVPKGTIGKETMLAWLEKQGEYKHADTDNKFIKMRETKPKDISEFLDRLTTVEQEFLWEHIAKIRELDKEKQDEWSEDGKAFYNKTIGLLKQYASDNEVRKQSAMSCINWLKSAIKHEKIAKYKIGDRVRFFSHAPIFTITGIDEANERYISQSGGFISFYEELIPAKGSLNKDDIKCGDYLTTEDGTVIKVHDIDENECVHHFYYASNMTEDGGDISNNFMYYCAILSDCRRSTQEEINFLEKWVAHKKYVWVKNNVSPYDEEED